MANGFTVWLQDAATAIEILHKDWNLECFEYITGTAYGDILVKTGEGTYLVNHNTFEVQKVR